MHVLTESLSSSFLTTFFYVMTCRTFYQFSFCFHWFQLAPTSSPSLVNSMKVIENPVTTCDKVYTLIQSLTSQIRKRLEDPKSAGSVSPQYTSSNVQMKHETIHSFSAC